MPGESHLAGSDFGSLGNCLVEGSAEQRLRQRRLRRRSLALSVAVQGLMLTTIVLVPLLGRAPRIALANITPVPPFYNNGGHAKPQPHPEPARHSVVPCVYCPNVAARPRRDAVESAESDTQPGDPFEGSGAETPFVPGAQPWDGLSRPSQPIAPHPAQPATPRRIRVGTVEPAMLIHRVEPLYPPLAKQTRKSGRVQLRAIIATDGTIQSLEILSGDPVFVLSARDAVMQWRYRPTILNGQPVEVETFITITYNMD